MNIKVVKKLGFPKACLLEHFFTLNPRNYKAKLTISTLPTILPLSISTVQRAAKELVEEGYLTKHGTSVFTFSPKFFAEFKDYHNLYISKNV